MSMEPAITGPAVVAAEMNSEADVRYLDRGGQSLSSGYHDDYVTWWSMIAMIDG